MERGRKGRGVGGAELLRVLDSLGVRPPPKLTSGGVSLTFLGDAGLSHPQPS